MSGKGTAVIYFGAFPGSSEAFVVITGQGSIASDSDTDAWFISVPTSDHTLNDHAYAAVLVGLTSGAIVGGTGFTIYARCLQKMQGTFNIEWAWA